VIPAPASTFGLEGWPEKLVLIAITVASAAIILAILGALIPRLISRMPAGTESAKWRQRQTAAALLSTVLRYVVLVSAVIVIVIILAGGGGIGALGGTAFVAIVIGFASQRLLADVIAGFFIVFEDQYGVGDLVELAPSGHTGVVEEVGIRTTIVREADGARCFVPNGQISAVRRLPSARSVIAVTLLTRDPQAAEEALQSLGDLAGAEAGVASAPETVSRRELGDGLVAVHARVGVAAALEDTARDLVAAVLRARLGDTLAADPVVGASEPRESERPEAASEL
jgi:small conductance mechanosensitive channel